jgi:hypothetical protein
VWLSSIIAGFTLLALHDTAKGAAGAAPPTWPAATRIVLSDRKHTLIMFAHPRCPCTRASLAEFEKVLARRGDSAAPWIVFYKPAGADDGWEQTDQWSTASRMPGVRIVRDIEGMEASRFHAATSGQTLLYSPAGELEFSGGITVARGHAGDNVGRSAIEAILAASTPVTRETPVFGCSIVVRSEKP